MYVYHATTLDRVEQIMEQGLLPGMPSNWYGMNMNDALYFAFSCENAEDFVATSSNYNGQDIVILAVDVADLDYKKIGYDWNVRCERESDIQSIAYYGSVNPEKIHIVAEDTWAENTFSDFDGTDLYEKIMDIFDTEVETNMEGERV